MTASYIARVLSFLPEQAGLLSRARCVGVWKYERIDDSLPKRTSTRSHVHTSIPPYILLLCLLAAWVPIVSAQQTSNIHGPFTIDIDCSACHRTEGWTLLKADFDFDHSRQTRFPLTGSHALTNCAGCHLDMRFDAPKIEANDCASCHVDVHQGEFPGRCVDCHNTTTFQEVEGRAIHNQTRFPLTGAHAQISCESCHQTDVGGAFSVLDTDCLSCHEPDYDAAHGATGFPTTCESCHNDLAWAATPPFDHAALANGFALLGAHESLACVDCHREPSFQPIFTPADQDDCLTCHQQDYEQQHGGTGLPTTCLDCHGIDTWDGAVFDHASVADGFDLVGSHEALDCAACHNPPPDFSPLFTPTDDTDCFTCHQADYEQEHAGSGFPTACLACHTTDNWDDAVFEHAVVSNGFGLVGAHEALDCSACHGPPPDLVPLFTPVDQDDCFTCHQDDYQDEHAGSGFPTTCLSCHNTNDWDDAVFDHASVADGFDLIGSHDALDCSACHNPPPGFEPLFAASNDEDCVACHEPDFQSAHAGSGFPTTCLSCHNTDAWGGVVFNHAAVANGFGLVGSHEPLPCLACHNPPPDFEPVFTPSNQDDCFTCHQDDYQQEHGGSGFPTTCLLCHNNNDWEDADFNHDAAFFPIFSGTHQGEWQTCMDCHTDPGNFNVFSCLTCHEHNQQDMADEHDDVPGYVYESSACYSCHPNGEEE